MSIIPPPPIGLQSETPQIEALSTNRDHWGAIEPVQSNVFSALGRSFRTNRRTAHFQKSNVRRSGAVASEFTYDEYPALPRMSARIIESPDFEPELVSSAETANDSLSRREKFIEISLKQAAVYTSLPDVPG
jgi:hypothetical protein